MYLGFSMSDFIIVDSVELQVGYLRVFVKQVCVYDNLTITLTRGVIGIRKLLGNCIFKGHNLYID